MADDKTSKESKAKAKKASKDADASEGKTKKESKGSRKKASVSKRAGRNSAKKSASAGTPVADSPGGKQPKEAGGDKPQTAVRRAESKKGGTQRSKNTKTGSGEAKKAKKEDGTTRLELTKKMTAAEYDKFCETECEMWVPCGRYKIAPHRKFVIPAGKLYRAETRAEDVPVQPTIATLNELNDRTKKYANRSAKASKSKTKRLRKIKSSVDDKFTHKKD